MMKFKKDSLPTNIKDRLKYLYRFQETLRLFHNVQGKKFRDGKMTETEFRRFQKEWFGNRNQLICTEIHRCMARISEVEREQCKLARKDKGIDIDISDIEE